MTLIAYALQAGIRLHNAMDIEQTAPNNAPNNTHLKETGPANSGEAATNSRSISFPQTTFSFHRRPANKNLFDVKERCGKMGSAPAQQSSGQCAQEDKLTQRSALTGMGGEDACCVGCKAINMSDQPEHIG